MVLYFTYHQKCCICCDRPNCTLTEYQVLALDGVRSDSVAGKIPLRYQSISDRRLATTLRAIGRYCGCPVQLGAIKEKGNRETQKGSYLLKSIIS